MILELFTSIHCTTRTFLNPLAVANFKHVILETPFFEKYVKTLKTELMSLTINTPQKSYVHTLPFTARKEKDYPYYSHIYEIKVKNKTYCKPNASQVVHFPIQPTILLTFKTSENDIIFASTPHPSFNSFNSTFKFLHITKKLKLNPTVALL